MEPTYELMLAALNKLRQTTALVAILGSATKIYDRVPEKQVNGKTVADVASPYVSFGPATVISEDIDCIDGLEVTFQIDAWSWGSGLSYGSVQVRQIAGIIRKALHKAELSLADNAFVLIRHELTRILRDSDGITNHAAIQFTAIIEQP